MKIPIKFFREIFLWMVVASLINLMGCSPSQVATGGGKWESVERLEFFYRSFDETAPFRFSDDDIMRVANFKGSIKNGSDLARLIGGFSLECEAADEPSEEQMDLHLLIKGYGPNKEKMVWKSSPFHFYDSSVGKVCVLNTKKRERLSALMQELSAPH